MKIWRSSILHTRNIYIFFFLKGAYQDVSSSPFDCYISGPLPPSRRRSLFTLATSMILFLSKAYNFVSLVDRAKAKLTDKQVSNLIQKTFIDIGTLCIVSWARLVSCKLSEVDLTLLYKFRLIRSYSWLKSISYGLKRLDLTIPQISMDLRKMTIWQ